MLKSLIRNNSVIHIEGKEYRVRYSLNCLLYLEIKYKPLDEMFKNDFINWNIEDILQLARAAMCDMPWNRKAVNNRDFDNIKPTLQELGHKIRKQDLSKLKSEIIEAILNSMPDAEFEDKDFPEKMTNEGHQRAMFVDIMGKSEKEFWNSNHKEISERINFFLETKGLKEIPDLVQMYDE